MTRREVWIVCLIIVMLGLVSLAYRMTTTTHFDAIAWRDAHDADDPTKFLQRRAMMSDVEKMLRMGRFARRIRPAKFWGRRSGRRRIMRMNWSTAWVGKAARRRRIR